jgi:polyisoprenoid-binding protein YceI
MFTLRNAVFGSVLAVAALFAIAAGGWWFFVREDASLATNAPAIPADLVQTPAVGLAAATATAGGSTVAGSAATPASAATSASSGTAFSIISDRSEAAYFAGETLASIGLPSTAKGSTTAITGTFYLTADGLGLDPSNASTFTVDLTKLASDKSMRDSKVQNQGLETSTYPTATFTATKVTGYDASLPATQQQTLQLTGLLDLHGVQKEVTWELKALRDGNVMTALATVNFKYAEFNIQQLNIGGFVSVDDNVTLQVQVVAQAT